MGGIARGLFGSRGQPGTAQDVSPIQFARLRDPVQWNLENLLSAGGIPGMGDFQSVGPGPGQNEMALIQQAMGQAQAGPGALPGQAQDLLSQTVQGGFLPGQGQANPFLQATIDAATRPLFQQFQEVTLPRLQQQATQAGQQTAAGASSPFDMAVARAQGGLADAVGDVGTRIAGQAFETERGRQQQAALAGPQAAEQQRQAELQRTIQGLQAVALPRMIEEQGIERGMQQFQQQISVLMNALGLAGQLGQPQVVQSEGTQGTPGLFGGLVSGFAPALGRGLAGSLFG